MQSTYGTREMRSAPNKVARLELRDCCRDKGEGADGDARKNGSAKKRVTDQAVSVRIAPELMLATNLKEPSSRPQDGRLGKGPSISRVCWWVHCGK